MTDIVERLRIGSLYSAEEYDTRHEAADEIDRLRKALRKIATSAYYDSIYSPDGDRHEMAIQIARAALGEDRT